MCVCVEVAVTLLGQFWQSLKKPYAKSGRWGTDMKKEGGVGGGGGTEDCFVVAYKIVNQKWVARK